MQQSFDITIGGSNKTIKMSFGLLNTLCATAGDIDGAALLALDNDLRNKVLVEMLSERDENGKISKEINLMWLDANPDEISALVDWAGEHIFDFFLKGLEKAKALQEKNSQRLQALMPTSSGSES